MQPRALAHLPDVDARIVQVDAVGEAVDVVAAGGEDPAAARAVEGAEAKPYAAGIGAFRLHTPVRGSSFSNADSSDSLPNAAAVEPSTVPYPPAA